MPRVYTKSVPWSKDEARRAKICYTYDLETGKLSELTVRGPIVVSNPRPLSFG